MKRTPNTTKVLAYAVVLFIACSSGAWGIRSVISHNDVNSGMRSEFGQDRGPWKPRVAALGDSTAEAVSLPIAKAQAAFPVLVPNADAVSSTVPDLTTGAPASEPATDNGTPPDNSARVVWLDHHGPLDVVAIEYNHLEIREEQMRPNYDGPKSYRDLVDQKADPNAYVGTVQGSAAYIVPPNNDQGTAHPGGAVFMKGNVQIRVEGYYPVRRLIAIANSLT
jgi:hypothetical protein